MQAAITSTAGADADLASAFLPVAFNVAIFVAGIFGAALLTAFSGQILAVVMVVFGLVTFGQIGRAHV